MKNEEISHKPTVQPHSSGEAYANAARSAWEKPASGASAKTESFAPHANSSGGDMGGPLTPQSGNSEINKDGSAGKPGGGGSRGDHNSPEPKGDGVGAFGKAAPSDKGSLPTENQNKSGGEGSHSVKPVEKKDKQDAALNFLPNLSIA